MAFGTSCCRKAPETDENKMIRLNVTVTVVDAERRAEVVDILNRLAEESRKEEGCIGYELFENSIRPEQLIIVETWESGEALAAHAKTPHYTTLLPQTAGLTTTKLERFEF